jgi:hypothetical protein
MGWSWKRGAAADGGSLTEALGGALAESRPMMADALPAWKAFPKSELTSTRRNVSAGRPIVSADRIGEGLDDDVGARGPRRPDGRVQVSHQVSRSLRAERIGDGRLEAEERDHSDRRPEKLRRRAAGRRRCSHHRPLRALASEGREEALHEPIDVRRRHIDMRRAVVCGHADVRRSHERKRGVRATARDKGRAGRQT